MPSEVSVAGSSFLPTVVSTGVPTSSPSNSLTACPSISPSQQASFNPSLPPVFKQSSTPSQSPLYLPSAISTFTPTISPFMSLNPSSNENYMNSSTYLNFSRSQLALTAYSSAGVYPFVFGTYSYLGNLKVGTCDSWKYFISTNLGFQQNLFYSSSIEAAFGTEIRRATDGVVTSSTSNTVQCSNADVASNLVASLYSGQNYDAQCDNGHMWRTFTCSNGGTVLCVDCPLSCFSQSCAGKQSMIVNPCQSPSLCQNYSTSQNILVSSYGVVRFDLKAKILYPTFLSPLTFTAFQNKIMVQANLSRLGIVYCAAFANDTVFQPSVAEIQSEGFYGSYVGLTSGIVDIDILSLQPDTNYRIFCVSSDFNSNAMDISTVLKYVIVAKTSCCKSIIFDTQSGTEIVASASLQNALSSPFSFHLNAQPNLPLTVLLKVSLQPTCNSLSTNVSALPTVSPKSFTFTSTSSLSGSFVVYGSAGCFFLEAISSNSKFQSSELAFQIRSVSTPPSPPRLISAVFSNDGLNVILTFNTPTDEGSRTISSFNSKFSCDLILFFRNKQVPASCMWASSSVLTVVFGSSQSITSAVAVGDVVQVLPNTLSAFCSTGSNCSTFPFATNSTQLSAVVQGPEHPIIPIASLNGPTSVWAFSSVTLDPTGSSGKGPQPWSSVIWEVDSSIWNLQNSSAVSQYLTKNFQGTEKLVTIPGHLIFPGTVNISLTVTNLFGRSSFTLLTLLASSKKAIPLVTILGPRNLNIYRWQPLLLTSNVTFSYFVNSSQKVYNWKLYEGANYLSDIRSISVDPTTFKLPRYSLDALKSYTLSLTVFSKSSPSEYATAYVTVSTGQAGVAAVISGGMSRSVSLLSGVVLNGSESVDKDYVSSKLNYSWSCVQLSPAYQGACSLYASSLLGDTNNPILSLLPNSTNLGKSFANSSFVYNFSLTVVSEKGLSSSTYTVLNISNEALPQLTIHTLSPKYDFASKIIVTGVVVNPDSQQLATASWQLIGMNLSGVAVTPTVSIVGTNSISSFQLSIRPYSLSPGLSYTLRLSAYYSPQHSSFAESLIVINTSPYGGKLSVVPSRGYEFNTTFSFTASLWLTQVDNYPLTYNFAYYDRSVDSQVYIPMTGIASYVSSILSRGLSASNFSVNCIVYVTDVYSSVSNASSVVQVFPTTSAAMSLELYSRAFQSATANGDTSVIVGMISTIANSISAANCSHAPNCSSLNRFGCKNIANTCGACFSGFIGVAGDYNGHCGSPSALLKNGYSCSSSQSCISGNCVNAVCKDSLKTCPNKCNGAGVCKFYSYYSNNEISSCASGDTSCFAQCDCISGTFGSDCSQTSSTLQQAQQLRDSLCLNLLNSLGKQDMTTSVMASRANNVADLTTDLTLLTPSGFENCAKVLVLSVYENPTLAADYLVMNLMVNAFNNILSKGSSIPPLLLSNISTALSLLSTSRQGLLAIGEEPSTFYTNTLAVLSVKNSLDALSSTIYSAPQSNYNSFNNAPHTTASIFSSSSGSRRKLSSSASSSSSNPVVGMNLVQYLNNPSGSGEKFSDVVVEGAFYDSISKLNLETQVTFQSIQPIDYSSRKVEFKVVACPVKSTPSNVSVHCSNGITYFAICPGNLTQNSINFTCPSFSRSPICTSFNGTEFIRARNCVVVNYSPTNTTCRCTVGNGSSFSSDFSAAYSDATSGSKYTIIKEPANLSVGSESAVKSVIIVIASGVVFATLVAAFFLRSRWDNIHNKFMQKYARKSSMRARRTFKQFFAQCLPSEFAERPSLKLFVTKLLLGHDFINAFTVVPSSQGGRDCFLFATARILNYIVVGILVVIFFFDETFSNCDVYTTKHSCNSDSHLLSNICEWKASNDSCVFSEPSLSFVNIIVSAIVIIFFSIPLEKFSRFLVSLFLEAISVSKKPAARTENYRMGDFELNHMSDEFSIVQNKHNTFLRAAALANMKSNIDSFSPIAEMNFMMKHRDVFDCEGNVEPIEGKKNLYSQFYNDNGAPYTRADVQNVTSKTAKLTMVRKLRICRNSAIAIKNDIADQTNENEQDLQLMKHFLADFLNGYKRIIANTVLFEGRVPAFHSQYPFNIASVVLLPLYFLAIVIFSIIFGLQISKNVAIIWIISIIVVTAEDAFWIQPIEIYIRDVAIPSLAKRDYLAILHVMSIRARSILSRESFIIMKNSLSLIQHFHPACRAARMLPHLAVSRVLMSLTDFDLPISHLLVGRFPQLNHWDHHYNPSKHLFRRFTVLFKSAFEWTIASYLNLPRWFQCSLLEMNATVIINGIIIALYCSYLVSVAFVVVLTIVTAAIFLGCLNYAFPELLLLCRSPITRKMYFSRSNDSEDPNLEEFDANKPDDIFVDSNLVYSNQNNDSIIYPFPDSPSSKQAAVTIKIKPVHRSDSSENLSTEIRLKPDRLDSARSSGSDSSGHMRARDAPSKSHVIAIDDSEAPNIAMEDVLAMRQKSFTTFFDSPASYRYSRTSKASPKLPLAEPSPQLSAASSKKVVSPRPKRETVTVEKARRIRALIRDSSKKQNRRPILSVDTDNVMKSKDDEGAEAKHENEFSSAAYDELLSANRPGSTRSHSERMSFASPKSRSPSNLSSNISEEESSPTASELASKRSSAIRKRLTQNRKKSGKRSPSMYPLSPQELEEKIASMKSPQQVTQSLELAVNTESANLSSLSGESTGLKVAEKEKSILRKSDSERTKATTPTVTFAIDKQLGEHALNPYKDSPDKIVKRSSPLFTGPRLVNIKSPKSKMATVLEVPVARVLSPFNSETATSEDEAKQGKPVVPFNGPVIGNITPQVRKPIRNENELKLVTVLSPGIDRNPSTPLDGVFRDSAGSNNSDMSVLRSAIINSPDSSDFSPNLSDIRSPNIRSVKLAPLNRPVTIRRPHRRKISSLHDRSKLAVSQSAPGFGALGSPDPLDATARKSMIVKTLTGALEEKEDTVDSKARRQWDSDRVSQYSSPSSTSASSSGVISPFQEIAPAEVKVKIPRIDEGPSEKGEIDDEVDGK